MASLRLVLWTLDKAGVEIRMVELELTDADVVDQAVFRANLSQSVTNELISSHRFKNFGESYGLSFEKCDSAGKPSGIKARSCAVVAVGTSGNLL
jgi:hypothetical protein